VIAPQPATTLYIYKVKRSFPAGVEALTNLVLNKTPTQFTKLKPSLTAWTTRSNRLSDIQIFQKPHLSHPDSKSDILYITLNLVRNRILVSLGGGGSELGNLKP
jgi:hypothetical protein